MKKPSLSKKEKEEKDKIWANAVKERDGHKCQWCGTTNRLTADHIFSRKVLATRWVVANGLVLCVGCHIFKKRYEPMEWALVVIRKLGLKKIEELEELHHAKSDSRV